MSFAAYVALLALISTPCMAVPAKVPPEAAVERILAANHAAVGDGGGPATIETEYAYSASGLRGTARSITDRATGAYVDSYDLGPSRGASGFDGRRAWMRDISGAYTPQDGGDRRQVAVNEAYRNANGWWRKDRDGARIELVGRETLDGAAADRLRVTPKGGRTFDAWFDASTHQLLRVDEMRQFFDTVTTFGDYAKEGGVVVAHAIAIDGGTGPSGLESMRLTRLAVRAARPSSAYAMPAWKPADAFIDGGAAQTVVPIRVLNNHIFVDAFVNGQGPFAFFVDTGGHTILTPSTVAALGVRSEGAASSAGAGDLTTTNGYAHVDEIAIGAAHLRDQPAFTLEISSKATEGFVVGGMIGFEFLRRFVVRIDYGALTMTVIDPARFDPRGAGTPIAFRFYDHLPQVEGRFGDVPGRFDIDTGSRSEVDLTSPFVARARLREAYPRGVLAVDGWGVGGPVKSYVVRGRSLTLGSVTVDGPVAGLATSRGGSLSDANLEGNVGSGLLRRFTVTFDYAHQRIYLEPRVPPPADAGTFDQSGLWINLGGDGFTIVDVATGSAGEEAGLAVGDVITAIGGQPATSISLSDARARLRVPPAGTTVHLQVARAGVARDVDITLRSQLDTP
ncbi:MAG TPA: aspartyl protease family protein [Casimicrobiaceae bacterium]|nr:aspartyl protease family protein [Casimicrobiaceae bacterium]